VHQLFIDLKKAYFSFRRDVLYNIPIEIGISMKLVRPIKLCPTETYSRLRVGKNLTDMFPIRNGLKQGDILLPFIFNCALEYAIRRVQVKQNGLKLNITHQILVYNNDDVNVLEVSLHYMKDKAETLLVTRKENSLELNADKSKYMVMSRDQNAGGSHSMKIDSSSLEGVEGLR
jgi:hypothetical protein